MLTRQCKVLCTNFFFQRERYCSEQTPLWLLQAMMLNCVGLAYGANEKTRASALNSFGDLVTLVSRERLLYSVSSPNPAGGDDTLEAQWSLWIEDEVKRRTAYFVWVWNPSRTCAQSHR